MAKSNREYWQERQIEAVLRSDENAKRIHQEMKQIYQDTADRINDEIAKFYGKFSKKSKIPINELIKILSVQELGKWKKGLEEYLEQINLLRETDEKQADALLLELNLLSGSTRINRLEALQGQIVAQMAYLAQIEDNKVRDHLVEEYQGNYYRSMYDLYKTDNPRVLNLMEQSRVRVDPVQIYDTLKLPWSGANYSQRIWKRQYDVANKVKNMVTRQLMVGTSMQSLTKEITAELGKDYKHAAERLIRTETAYAHTMADLEVYKRLGIEEYEYIATLDHKTSEICQSLDLKRFKVSEAQVGKNYPPMHPHCRSTTGIYDPEWDGETRIARGADGKNYSVSANMNYEEWYEEYVENSKVKADDIDLNEFTHKESNIEWGNHIRNSTEKLSRILNEVHTDLNRHMVENKTEKVSLINLLSEEVSIEQVSDIINEVQLNKSIQNVLKKSEENSLILSHVHPSRASFSLADLKLLERNKSIKIMTLELIDGEKHILERGELKTVGLFQKSKIEAAFQEATHELSEKYPALNGESVDEIAKIWDDFTKDRSILLAEKLGMIFKEVL